MTPTRKALDHAIVSARLLDHPFYRAWASGTLTTDDLSFYAGQYWRQVAAFPGYLETIAGRLPEGAARDAVLANLADERDGDHPGLWLEFAEAVGCRRDEVVETSPEPETAACVAAFADAVAKRSPAFALGMLYGYESQTPEVAVTKVEGLTSHYGIAGPGLEYFELHGELDVEHSAEMAGAIDDIAAGETGKAEAVAGARAGAQAIWKLLDGVARARDIV